MNCTKLLNLVKLAKPRVAVVKPESEVPESRPKGLGLTLKSHGPLPHIDCKSKYNRTLLCT